MSEISNRIKLRREELGMTTDELAKKMGYKDRSSITKIEKGKADIPQSKVLAFARALETTTAYLIGIDEEKEVKSAPAIPRGFQPMPEMVQVPRVGRIACGTPILAEENIERTDTIPAYLHADYTLLCVGNSMAPKFQDGDVVCIRTQPEVENGEVAAVLIGEEATLKQVFLHDDFIELRPLNPEYQSIIRTKEDMNDVTIEGKAVGLVRAV